MRKFSLDRGGISPLCGKRGRGITGEKKGVRYSFVSKRRKEHLLNKNKCLISWGGGRCVTLRGGGRKTAFLAFEKSVRK